MDMISEKDFKALVRSVESNQSDMDEARGSMGNAVKAAVEKKFLEKRAFGIYRRLKRLGDLKLATTLLHLEHYCEVGGLNQRANAQRELIERGEELAKTDAAVEAEPKRKGRARSRKSKAPVAEVEQTESATAH